MAQKVKIHCTCSKAGLYVTLKRKKSSDENEMVEDMIVIACNSDQLGMYDDDDS